LDEGPDADPAPGAKAIPAQKIRRLPAGGAKETRSLSPLRAMGMHRARTVTIPVARAWGGSVAARSVLDAHPANGESPSGAGGSIRFAFQPGKFLANALENHQLKKILDENRTRPNLQDYPMAALAGERVRMLLKLGLTR